MQSTVGQRQDYSCIAQFGRDMTIPIWSVDLQVFCPLKKVNRVSFFLSKANNERLIEGIFEGTYKSGNFFYGDQRGGEMVPTYCCYVG